MSASKVSDLSFYLLSIEEHPEQTTAFHTHKDLTRHVYQLRDVLEIDAYQVQTFASGLCVETKTYPILRMVG